MKKQRTISRILSVAALATMVVSQAFLGSSAFAAQITARSLTLQANGANGGSTPNVAANHLFSFTIPTTGNVGSIQFEYCTTAAGACTKPTGLTSTSATLGAQTGETSFTINNTTDGAPYITRTASSVTGPQAVTYRLDGVVNPTAANETFHVRISTYASIDTTGGSTDLGTVTASTAEPIVLSGTMPESLVFCTGATVGTTSSVPDCATATSGVIAFNQLFSPTTTATASSQMAASTNAGSGYAITVNGPTLTSGGNTIAGMAAGASVKGIAQFGLNLKANTVAAAASFPGSSVEVAPAANGTNYRGQASAGYATADSFKFTTGDAVAASDNGGAGGTDAQIFTASYIANVPGSQPAGTYTSTLTYICTPTF